MDAASKGVDAIPAPARALTSRARDHAAQILTQWRKLMRLVKVEDLRKEIEIQRKLDHPNIVRIYEVF